MTNTSEKIIELLESRNGAFVDAHNKRFTKVTDSIGYVVLRNIVSGEEFVCPIFKNYFTLNPLYAAEDNSCAILDPGSVGGLMDMINYDPEMAVNRYNDEHEEFNKNFASKQQITCLHLYEK